ncbi:MAG: hypothetical protein ACREL5_12930 [Gemmatimonadales bacterium]
MDQKRNDDLEAYRAKVSSEMKRRYGLTWDDACGVDERLIPALNAGETPAEFVAWWGEKYDLIELADLL